MSAMLLYIITNAILFFFLLTSENIQQHLAQWILAPIFLPVAIKLGIDPIHLGIVMVINMELGMITPPVGLNIYVASGLARYARKDTGACKLRC